MKKLTALFFTMLLFIQATAPLAIADSDTFTTCIKGRPCKIQNSSDSLIQAGLDVAAAYNNCPVAPYIPGTTVVISNTNTCIRNYLLGKHYSADKLAWTSNMNNYAWGDHAGEFGGNSCIECIGFVRQALQLAFGTPEDTVLSGHSANWLPSLGITTFKYGSTTFKEVSGPPKEGDVGITGGFGSFGHILIVYKAAGAQFTAIESNFVRDCYVSTNHQHTTTEAPWLFYRRQ